MKNWKTKVLSTALVLAVMVPTASFASDAGSAAKDFYPGIRAYAHFRHLNTDQLQAAEDKMLDLITQYAPASLDDWKDALSEQEQLMSELKEQAPVLKHPELSDEAKEKMEDIREKVEQGEITRAEARKELLDLGFGKGFDGKQKFQLSDEMKAKLEAIREQVENGTLTREQAAEQFEELGLNNKIILKQRPQLSDEVKAKVEAIHEEVKNGTLTREQAREELQELGLDKPFPGVPGIALQKAVDANDDAGIKELLPQMLEQLKDRNQRISSKLQAN